MTAAKPDPEGKLNEKVPATLGTFDYTLWSCKLNEHMMSIIKVTKLELKSREHDKNFF